MKKTILFGLFLILFPVLAGAQMNLVGFEPTEPYHPVTLLYMQSNTLVSIGEYTGASLPAASSSNSGKFAIVTDVSDTTDCNSVGGSEMAVCFSDGNTWTSVFTGSGSGDVSGPGVSTDNAIVRFDGIDGDTLQNSSVYVDDDGNIVTPGDGEFTNMLVDLLVFNEWPTFTAADTTPDVSTSNCWIAGDTTKFEDFDGSPVDGQPLFILCSAAAEFDIDDGTGTKSGIVASNRPGEDLTATVGFVALLIYAEEDTQWHFLNAPDVSTDLSAPAEDSLIGYDYSASGVDWFQFDQSTITTDSSRDILVKDGGITAAKLATDADDDAIEFVLDGGGSEISTGIQGFLEVPYACTISAATALADQSGSIVVDVWKDTYANYPPTDADSITASAPITISSATKSQDTTLSGWTTSLTKGDIIGYNVDSVTTCERVTISLKVDK